MKFSVGMQTGDPLFLQRILEEKEKICEVYFSWGELPNGRGQSPQREATLWEAQNALAEALTKVRKVGIGLHLLLNGNCYGGDSLSRRLFERIGDTVELFRSRFGLKGITTTSPVIAKFLKANFPDLPLRASVNMEIGTALGMDYLHELFDGFYLKREFNRDFERIRKLKAYCDKKGKKLYLLANSGCLNFCSARTFHDNLVSHEAEISTRDNAFDFTGLCRDYLKRKENYPQLYQNMNFLRPEEVSLYEGLVESMKLATRVHPCPTLVLDSYLRGSYEGDLLRLLEPTHSIYPYALENADPVKLICLKEDGQC